MAARFTHLTTRQDNRLARQQARTARAAALLRWTTSWSPATFPGVPPSPPRPARRAGLGRP